MSNFAFRGYAYMVVAERFRMALNASYAKIEGVDKSKTAFLD